MQVSTGHSRASLGKERKEEKERRRGGEGEWRGEGQADGKEGEEGKVMLKEKDLETKIGKNLY